MIFVGIIMVQKKQKLQNHLRGFWGSPCFFVVGFPLWFRSLVKAQPSKFLSAPSQELVERHGKRVTLHFGEALEEVPFHRAWKQQQTNTSLVMEFPNLWQFGDDWWWSFGWKTTNLWHFGDFWGQDFGGKILGDKFKLWWMNWGVVGLGFFFRVKNGIKFMSHRIQVGFPWLGGGLKFF